MAVSSSYPQYVAVVAPKYGLPAALVSAIVKHESGGDRFAHRVEPSYRWLWDVRLKRPYGVAEINRTSRVAPVDFPAPPGISATTEWIDQQSSWGLMQVMGAVAREQGFTGFLPGLCDPLAGLHAGCRHLAALRDKYLKPAGWAGVVAAYNAGTPGTAAGNAYVTQVLLAANAADIGVLTA